MKFFTLLLSTALAHFASNGTEGFLRSLKQIDKLRKLSDVFQVFRDTPGRRLAKARGIPGVSITTVKDHLRRSFISSCPAETILGFRCVCNTKYRDLAIVKGRQMESLALLAADVAKRHLLVTYRPTMTLKNWITNADFAFVAMDRAPPGVRVHRGFHAVHASLRDKVFAAAHPLLSNPKYRGYTVHITGYSLGGAIATLALPDWVRFMQQYNFTNPIESYAYSSPRIGNEAFAKYVASTNVPVIRYTNNNDVVPHLPPRSLGFTHAGLEYHFAKGRIVQCRQDYDEDPNCALKHTFPLSFATHYFPDGKLLPLPPYC